MELFTTLEIIRMCIRFVPLMLAIIDIYKLKQIESKMDTISNQLLQITKAQKKKDMDT